MAKGQAQPAPEAGSQKVWSEDRVRSEAKATLASIVQSALTENGVGEIVQRISRLNRQPINTAELASDTELTSDADLNQEIARFQARWQDLYGQQFDVIGKPQVVFAEPAVQIQLGQHLEGAQLAAAKQPPESAEPPEAAAGVMSPNELVRVQLPEFHDAPALTVDLRKAPAEASSSGGEQGIYRLLVPDTTDAKQLKQNLLHCLKGLDEQQERWPESTAEAERIVSQKILAAIAAAPAQGD